MSYPPDPGRVFASDVHRRVMANLPNPDQDALTSDGVVTERIAKDDYLNIHTVELEEVLQDLEADGHAEQDGGYWRNTESGFEALTGPVNEPGQEQD